MVYNYYHRLRPAQRRIYDKSDTIDGIKLPQENSFRPCVEGINNALRQESRGDTERSCQSLADEITTSLNTIRTRVKVLEKRPSNNWGELHGLYEPAESNSPPCITVWMRTAQRKQVVAIRTFLRTLLHELCHHLDYEYLKLADSFHTEGFYKRETSLFQQITRNVELPNTRSQKS